MSQNQFEAIRRIDDNGDIYENDGTCPDCGIDHIENIPF